MKRTALTMIAPALIVGGLVLLTLAACGKTAPAAETPEPTPPPAAETAAPTAPPLAETFAPAAAPVLSEGAAADAALSGPIQTGEDGTVYTTLTRGEGLTYLPDLLPEETGYVAGFLRAPAGFYAAVKEAPYSLEPAALYYYPDEGEARLITDELHPGGLFCLSGGALFFTTHGDSGLWRLADGEEEPRQAVEGDAWLLGADSGFIYYAKDGGVCRNDSTMDAETRLFDDDGVSRVFAAGADLCDVTYTGEAAALEFRGADGSLRRTVELGAGADSVLYREGRIYTAGEDGVRAYSLADGEALAPIPLPEGQSYVTLRGIAGGMIYYEFFDGTSFRLGRVSLEGGEAQDLGGSALS